MDLPQPLAMAYEFIGQIIIVKTLNGSSIKGRLLSINPNSIVVKRDSDNLVIANMAIDSILGSNGGIS